MVPIFRWTHCFGDISSPSMSWRRPSMPQWKIESNARGVPNGYWNISALFHQNCHHFLSARRERTRCQKAGRWRIICMRKTPLGNSNENMGLFEHRAFQNLMVHHGVPMFSHYNGYFMGIHNFKTHSCLHMFSRRLKPPARYAPKC